MGCTVEELGRRLSSRALTTWQAFYELEPWGCVPADHRAQLVAWAAMSPHTKGADGKPLPFSTFRIKRGDEPPPREHAEGTDEAALERFLADIEQRQQARRKA
jgi:hypothetical protein